MHHTADSPGTVSATVTAVLGASVSSSNVSAGLRKVRLSDRELFQRVYSVVVPDEPVNLRGLSAKRGWRHVRAGVSGRMNMHYRTLQTAQTRQCQVFVGGEIRARASELMSLLRAPTESESNALLHELFGSRFIYSSLVHAVSGSERGLVLSPYARGSATATGQQLMVRTASFVHTGVLNHFKQRASTTSDTPPNSTALLASQSSTSPPPQASGAKNEQLCYIEFLTPTQEGFAMVFCSLDASDISAGKAPSERVIALHPMSGWLTVQPKPDSPEMLEITFQAAFPGSAPGGCDARVAQNRLLFIAKGVCRLDKVLRRRRRYRLQQRTTSGRLWQALLKPFRVLGVTDDDTSGGARHNWHCIACTRSLLPTLNKRWRRCDLCAYRVCADPPCCSQERVAIYSRYVAPLLVCARCRECIDERESPPRSSGYPVGGARGDARYAGVCLRFTDQEMDLEPEMERDPSIRSHDRSIRVGATHSTGTRRSSEGIRTKRRTQSDPPPMLGLALSSSGDDNSFSGTDLDPGQWSK